MNSVKTLFFLLLSAFFLMPSCKRKEVSPAAIKIGYKWGFTDKKGKIIIPPKYDNFSYFSHGLATIKENGKWGIINTKGKYVIYPMLDSISKYHDGFVEIKLKNKWGYYCERNDLPDEMDSYILPKYDETWAFYGNYAKVRVGKFWGMINNKGDYVISPKYDDLWNFHEGLAKAKLNGNFGFVNTTGNIVIPFIYSDASLPANGQIKVKLGNKWGMVNLKGHYILLPAYKHAYDIPQKEKIGQKLKKSFKKLHK